MGFCIMPKYYCEYCDAPLTHDSPAGRKQHNTGFRHKSNVRAYYANFVRVREEELALLGHSNRMSVGYCAHNLVKPTVCDPQNLHGFCKNSGVEGIQPLNIYGEALYRAPTAKFSQGRNITPYKPSTMCPCSMEKSRPTPVRMHSIFHLRSRSR